MAACALALVLLLDASASILTPQWELMVRGHADALQDEAVVRAIEGGDGVAVTALAFSEGTSAMVGWRVLRTTADAAAFGAELRAAPRGYPSGTDMGGALHSAMRALGDAPCLAEQEVIDLATDGEANPESTRHARAYAQVQGIRINAIGIGKSIAEGWLRENAVTEDGFAISAEDWSDFARAIRRKLVLELAQR